jgi:hypothetical protein
MIFNYLIHLKTLKRASGQIEQRPQGNFTLDRRAAFKLSFPYRFGQRSKNGGAERRPDGRRSGGLLLAGLVLSAPARRLKKKLAPMYPSPGFRLRRKDGHIQHKAPSGKAGVAVSPRVETRGVSSRETYESIM